MPNWQGGEYPLPNYGWYFDTTSNIGQIIMGFKISVKKQTSVQPGDCQTGKKHFEFGADYSGELYISQFNPDFRNLLANGYYAISSATYGGLTNYLWEDLTAVVAVLTLSGTPDDLDSVILLDENSNIRLKKVAGPPGVGEFSIAAAVCTLNAAQTGHRFKCGYSVAEAAGLTSALQITGSENATPHNGMIIFNERLIETGVMITNRVDLYNIQFKDFDLINMPADGVPPTQTITFDCNKTSNGILKYYMQHLV